MDSLPIVDQLEFAANLLLKRGGDRRGIPGNKERDEPINSELVTATEVVQTVIGILRKHSNAGALNAMTPS
jgi:hypothetical protein